MVLNFWPADCLNTTCQISIYPVQLVISPVIRQVAHEMDITLRAKPPFPGINPTLIFHPFPCLFFCFAIGSILQTIRSDFRVALHRKLIVFFNDQYGSLSFSASNSYLFNWGILASFSHLLKQYPSIALKARTSKT